MIRPVQGVGSYIPVHPPMKTQAAKPAEPAFGLKTVSFEGIHNIPQLHKPNPTPPPNVGTRLNFLA